ncbi:hypothetical protein niasHT_007938 [Heterodera trifolii]|uniref:RRM domain-containing protein n=1 Tax=Heterodera trifolii TaxID=157864 RepID=A0ABD2LZG9_9BILA
MRGSLNTVRNALGSEVEDGEESIPNSNMSDSAPNNEPRQLSFLERYREDPNSNSCIRLENVPKMVYAEQLAEFLGVQFDAPYENIARMQNGVLYIHLPNEAMATKAAIRNMNILNGHQIAITQLKRAEMADAIRQNMIIIREMYRDSVVARGFPLNEVVALFRRINLNEQMAVGGFFWSYNLITDDVAPDVRAQLVAKVRGLEQRIHGLEQRVNGLERRLRRLELFGIGLILAVAAKCVFNSFKE